MRAGRLDRLIDIQRATYAPSDSGEPQATWANIASRRPASMRPVKGDETFATTQIVAQQETEFRIRYSADVATLNAKDRIIFPAQVDGEDPENAPKRYIYDILAVHRIGRREGFQIIAQRRPELFEVADVPDESSAGEPIGLLLILTKAA